MIHSDWHIHTTASHDSWLAMETVIASGRAQGLEYIGISDHIDTNEERFMNHMRLASRDYHRLRSGVPELILGAELEPYALSLHEHIARTGSRDGWAPDLTGKLLEPEMAVTKQQLMDLGFRYVIGAAHVPLDERDLSDRGVIAEFHRLQMWLAQDARVTILGHPWTCCKPAKRDFTMIPRSMHDELAAALKENGKFIECNGSTFIHRANDEAYRHRYAEFLRYMFEKGVPMTYGSDCHGRENLLYGYPDHRITARPYLEAAGFREGDFSHLTADVLW